MKFNLEEFRQLMQTVADGWNEGDAHKAADCFSQDAVYVEPLPRTGVLYFFSALGWQKDDGDIHPELMAD